MYSAGSQMPCQKDTQAALWRRSQSKELSLLSHSRVSEPSGEQILRSRSSQQMTATIADLEDAAPWETLNLLLFQATALQSHLGKLPPNPLTTNMAR